MKELYAFCEGPTEQQFCVQVLTPHLFPQRDGMIHPIRIAHAKRHGKTARGGVGKYPTLKRDIQNTFKSRKESNVYFTTLIDLYALPIDFPGKANLIRNPQAPTPYVLDLEKALSEDIDNFRFIPYIQLHEYETMLFADPDAFRGVFEKCEAGIQTLKSVVASFPSIEHINDRHETCPSQRIIDAIPAYEGRKSSAGPDVADRIGIQKICEKCPHFDQWVKRLEQLDWGCD